MSASFQSQWRMTQRSITFRRVEAGLHELTQPEDAEHRLHPSIEAHSRGVSILGALLVHKAGMTGKAFDIVAVAGLTHDFGKIVHPELYQKRHVLTAEEIVLKRLHAEEGFDVAIDMFPDYKDDQILRVALPTGFLAHCQFLDENNNYPSQAVRESRIASGQIRPEDWTTARELAPIHATSDITDAVLHRNDPTRAYLAERLAQEGESPISAQDIFGTYDQVERILGSDIVRISGFSPAEAVAAALEYRDVIEEYRGSSYFIAA